MTLARTVVAARLPKIRRARPRGRAVQMPVPVTLLPPSTDAGSRLMEESAAA